MATAEAHAPPKAVVVPRPAYPRKVGEHLQPLYTLTEAQSKTLATFRSRMADLDEYDRDYADDACLIRYLRARNWHVDPAEKLLRGTMAWRKDYGIEQLSPSSIASESCTGKQYIHGQDRKGRPVIYQKPRYENSKDHDAQVRFLAYILERSANSMELSKGVEQHVLMIDFKGYSLSNAPPLKVARQSLTLFMDRFPERLGNAFLVDAPRLFTAMYTVLKPIIPEETKSKVHFIKRTGNAGRNGRMDPVLAQFFDDDDVEEDYGGTLPSTFDNDTFQAAEEEAWQVVQSYRTELRQRLQNPEEHFQDALDGAVAAPDTEPEADTSKLAQTLPSLETEKDPWAFDMTHYLQVQDEVKLTML